MKRHLAIPLALGIAAALPVATIGADLSASNESLVVPAVSTKENSGTTGYGCCWVYIYGRWICLPC